MLDANGSSHQLLHACLITLGLYFADSLLTKPAKQFL